MNPILYDMIRTLKNKWVIILTVLVILISLAVIPLVQSINVVTYSSQNTRGYYYYDSGYHFEFYSFNQFGKSIQNVRITLSVSGTSVNISRTIYSNISGFSNLYVNIPNSNYYLNITVNYPGATSPITYPSYLPSAPNNTLQFISILGNPFTPIQDERTSGKVDLLVYYPALNSTGNGNFSIYYYVSKNPSEEMNMTYLGSFRPNVQIYTLPSFKNYSQGYLVNFVLKSNNSTILTTSLPAVEFSGNVMRNINPESIGSSFVSSVLTLFYPLIAILSAYSVYGKDRVTGTLESVLSRPITRTKLTMSRFISIMLALFISIAITITVVGFIISTSLHIPMFSLNFTLLAIISLLVDACAFVLIIFIFSHLVKSSSLLIGVAIALFVIFDFFWSLIVFIVSEIMGYGLLSLDYYRIDALLSYFNPAQFYSLAYALLSGSYSGFTGDLSLIGITPFAVIASGILWILVPLAVLYYLVRYRD